MPYTRVTLQGLSSKERSRWERQAAALHRRAQHLLHEVLTQHGNEHPLSDVIDNVVHAAEDLCDTLLPENRRL